VDLAVSLPLYNILYNINFDFTFSVSKMKEKLEVEGSIFQAKLEDIYRSGYSVVTLYLSHV
jgi:hypothetical protein